MPTIDTRGLIVMLAAFAYTLSVIATFGIARNLLIIVWPAMIEVLGITYVETGFINAAHHLLYLSASIAGGTLIAQARSVQIILLTILPIAVLTSCIAFTLSYYSLLIIYGCLGALIALHWLALVRTATRCLSEQECAFVLSVSASGTAAGFLFGGGVSSWLLATFGVTNLWIVAGAVIAVMGACVFVALGRLTETQRQTATKEAKLDSIEDPNENANALILHIISFLLGFCIIGTQVYLSSSILADRAIDHHTASLIWVLFGAGGLLSGFFLSAVARKLSVTSTIVIALASVSVALPILAFGSYGMPLILGAFVFGLGSFGIFGLLPVVLRKLIPSDRHIVHYGRANFFVGLGSLSTSVIGGALRDQFGSFAPYWALLVFGLVAAVILMQRVNQITVQVPI